MQSKDKLCMMLCTCAVQDGVFHLNQQKSTGGPKSGSATICVLRVSLYGMILCSCIDFQSGIHMNR